MTTEFDPQGRVYWGPHALSFPSAIWFDNSADPFITLKVNVGGEGSNTQYLQLASFNRHSPEDSLIFATATGSNGGINTLLSTGGGESLIKQKIGSDVEMFSVDAVDGLSVTNNADTLTWSFDSATLTSTQITDLIGALLPLNSEGYLRNDGLGNLGWSNDLTAKVESGAITSTDNSITLTEASNILDLSVAANTVSQAIADYITANPTSSEAMALIAAMGGENNASLPGGDIHQALINHYTTNATDLAELQAVALTDSDTRVVVSFADTDGDGENNALRVEVFAIDPETGSITGNALGTTDLPLTMFATGVVTTNVAAPLSGDGSTAKPITLTDGDLATALTGSLSANAIRTAASQIGTASTSTTQSATKTAFENGCYLIEDLSKVPVATSSLQRQAAYTIQHGEEGVVVVSANIYWNANNQINAGCLIYKNGTEIAGNFGHSGVHLRNSCSTGVFVTSGDIIELIAFQQTGGTQSLIASKLSILRS